MVVSNPSCRPDAASSSFAWSGSNSYHGTPAQPFGMAHGVYWLATTEPGGKNDSVSLSRSMPIASARRTRSSPNGPAPLRPT